MGHTLSTKLASIPLTAIARRYTQEGDHKDEDAQNRSIERIAIGCSDYCQADIDQAFGKIMRSNQSPERRMLGH